MRGILVCLALSGCVVKHSPQPSDTNLNESERDWLRVYEHELKVAIENDDLEAWRFFWPYYLKEFHRQNSK